MSVERDPKRWWSRAWEEGASSPNPELQPSSFYSYKVVNRAAFADCGICDKPFTYHWWDTAGVKLPLCDRSGVSVLLEAVAWL